MLIDELKMKIKEFAIENNCVQQSDIEKIELSNIFNKKEYDDINNKYFISIIIIQDEILIEFGQISIEVDTIDEEDYYEINKNMLFFIPFLPDSMSSEEIISSLKIKCKEFLH